LSDSYVPIDPPPAASAERAALAAAGMAGREDTRLPIGRAIAGGAVAAVVGATAWALMVIETNHSFGIAAVLLGLLSATLVDRFTGGRRGIVLVAVAVVSILSALVVGKYSAFAYLIHRDAQAQYGSAGAAYFGYLSGHTWDAFNRHLGDEFSVYYLLWVGIGITSAWRTLGPLRSPAARVHVRAQTDS
jgi:hypothetical protein